MEGKRERSRSTWVESRTRGGTGRLSWQETIARNRQESDIIATLWLVLSVCPTSYVIASSIQSDQRSANGITNDRQYPLSTSMYKHT